MALVIPICRRPKREPFWSHLRMSGASWRQSTTLVSKRTTRNSIQSGAGVFQHTPKISTGENLLFLGY